MAGKEVSEFVKKLMETTTEKFDIFTVANGLSPSKNETGMMKAQLCMYDIIVPFLGIFIIIANLLVVISSGLLLKKGQEPRCTYLLLGNVALADLITALTVISGAAIPQSLSLRTHTTCCFHLGAILSSTIASVYSVALIAVDRFLYILHGLKYHRLIYITRVRSMIVATWLFGCFIGFLPLMGWSGNTMNGKMCWFTTVAPPELIILITLIGVVPIMFVTALYSIILYSAIKKVIQIRAADPSLQKHDARNATKLRMFRGGSAISHITTISGSVDEKDNSKIDSSTQELTENSSKTCVLLRGFKNLKVKNEYDGAFIPPPNPPTKWKAIKVVLFVTGSFIFTWMPYFIACGLFVLCDFQKTPLRCQKLQFAIASPLAILGFTNSLLNPIIYAWWHNGFRTSIKKMYYKRKNISKCNQTISHLKIVTSI